MKTTRLFLVSLIILILASYQSKATVTDSTTSGFTVKFEKLVKVSPDSLYTFLVRDIGKWWNQEHTWSGSAANLSIDPVANGCFCEKLANGGSVRHMTVVFASPGKMLRMEGGMGPLQGLAVAGIMTYIIKNEAGFSRITLTYSAGGYIPGGAQKWAPIVDKVLGEQFGRLTGWAEKRR
ncbi:MAG: ATPase [Bacteroidota bacterium]